MSLHIRHGLYPHLIRIPALLTTFVRGKGHSKWQNIKHTKTARDATLAKAFNFYVQRITSAVKENGYECDPKKNKSLDNLLQEAIKSQVPQATIEKTLKRLSIAAKSADEHLMYVSGPAKSFFLIKVLASTRIIAHSDIAVTVRKNFAVFNDQAKNVFIPRGVITVDFSNESGTVTHDAALEIAIECGAEEVELDVDMGHYQFLCSGESLYQVKKELEIRSRQLQPPASMTLLACEMNYMPRITTRPPNSIVRGTLQTLIQKLEAINSVQQIFHNIDLDTKSENSVD